MKNKVKLTYIIAAILALFIGELVYVLQPISKEESLKFISKLEEAKKNSNLKTGGMSRDRINLLMNMNKDKQFTKAFITTNKGTLEIELSNLTPNTTKNFGVLANSEFYNGVRFHRVIKGVMVQTGDPLTKSLEERSKWGTGGPGYRFKDELTGNEKYSFGTVAMANIGPDTNGSQFFIITANPEYPSPPNYTIFGKVTKGSETLKAIQNVKTDPVNRPIEDVIIEKIEVR